ncbi:unnamed protein product [Urochloa humidicola]
MAACSSKLPLVLLALAAATVLLVSPCAAQNSPQDYVDPHNAARSDVGVRGELRGAAAGGLRPAALRRAIRREHLLGLHRQGLVGGGRRGVVGVREAVVRSR